MLNFQSLTNKANEIIRNELSSVEESQVREHLNKLVISKSVGPGGMQPHVLTDLANVSIIFEMSWPLGEVPEIGKKANASTVFKKCKKDDPGTTGWSSSLSSMGR